MVNQEKLLKEIKSLSDSIREKNRALKLGISERENFLESTFKPVTEPLKQLVQKIDKSPVYLEGDTILPISKYEDEQSDTTSYRQLQSSDDESSSYRQLASTGEESEVSEEIEESNVLRRKRGLSSTEEEEHSTSPTNLSKLGAEMAYKGTLGRKYFLKMLHSTIPNRNYHTFGARVESTGIMIGDSKLDVTDNDEIVIGNKKYNGTKGLFELIFKQVPGKYTKKDLALFKTILESTNAHRKQYSKNQPIHRNRSEKYKSVISTIFPSQLAKKDQIKRRAISTAELNVIHKRRRTTEPTSSGKGLMKKLYDTNIIYYNDINKLVDRMRLLHEAMEAGHTGLENEWIALIDELRNRGIIAK